MSAGAEGAIWIESVTARRIGAMRDEQLSFKPGFNLVYGKNEAGKSTLRSLISFLLFGVVPTHLELSEPQGSMELRVGERRLFVERSWDRGRGSKMNKRLFIEEELGVGGGRYRTPLAPDLQNDDYLGATLGGLDAGVFADFYSIDLAQIITSDTKSADVVRRIQEASVIGGGTSPTAVAKDLQKRAGLLWPPRKPEPGSINALVKSLEEVRTEIRNLNLVAKDYERLILQRDEVMAELERIRAAIADSRSQQEDLERAERLGTLLGRRRELESSLAPLLEMVEVPTNREAEITEAFDALENAQSFAEKVSASLEAERAKLAEVDPGGLIAAAAERIAGLDRRRERAQGALEDLTEANHAIERARGEVREYQAGFGIPGETPISEASIDSIEEALSHATTAAKCRDSMELIENELASREQGRSNALNSYSQALGRLQGVALPDREAMSVPGPDSYYERLAAELEDAQREAGRGARLERDVASLERDMIGANSRAASGGSRAIGWIALALLILAGVAIQSGSGGTLRFVLAAAALVVAFFAVLALFRVRSSGAQKRNEPDLAQLRQELRTHESQLARVLPSFGDFASAQASLMGASEAAARLREEAGEYLAYEAQVQELRSRMERFSGEMETARSRVEQLCSGICDPSVILNREASESSGAIAKLRGAERSLSDAKERAERAKREIADFASVTRTIALEVGLSTEGEPVDLLGRLVERLTEVNRARAALMGFESELAQAGLEPAQAAVGGVVEEFGISSRADWRDYLERNRERESLRGELDAIANEEQELASALAESAFGSELLSALGSGASLVEHRNRIEDAKRVLDEELNAANQELGALEHRISDAGVDERLVAANTRAESLRAEIAEVFLEWAAHSMAERFLRDAVERFGQEKSRGAAELASDYFSELTDHRYTRLDLHAAVPTAHRADGANLTLESLSRGTLDLAYLATRFGLATYSPIATAQGPMSMPMVLDDVLVNHDHLRARAVIGLLLEMAESSQLIFMTCHEHLRALVEDVSRTDRREMPSMLEIGA